MGRLADEPRLKAADAATRPTCAGPHPSQAAPSEIEGRVWRQSWLAAEAAPMGALSCAAKPASAGSREPGPSPRSQFLRYSVFWWNLPSPREWRAWCAVLQ
jgi:hypothetical protein